MAHLYNSNGLAAAPELPMDVQDYDAGVEHVDPFDEQDQLLQQQHETSGSPALLNGSSKKRKITRTRPLRSCVACNRRKIKCDRLENGTGGCTPCIKRGEGDSCSLVSGTNHPFQSTASILYRLDRLEARVEELESGTPTGELRQDQPKLEEGTSLDGSEPSGRYGRLNNPGRQPQIYPEYIAPSHGHATRAPPQSNDISRKPSPSSLDTTLSTSKSDAPPKESTMDTDLGGPACDTEAAAQVLENMYAARSAKGVETCPTPSSNSSNADDRSQTSTICTGSHLQDDSYSAKRSLEIRLRVLRSSAFPSRALADHLITSYFASLDVYWHIHINYLFEAEYNTFWTMIQAERHADIDPAWVAVLLMTLSLGLQVSYMPLPQHCLANKHMSVDDMLAMSSVWVDDVEELLKAADWSRKPQFRTLQTIILLCGYQTLWEFREGSGVTWIGAAIRVAQQMRLHLLGEDCKMPEDDPALPTGSNNVKVQFGRRTWLSLLVLEGVYALRLGRNLPLASAGSTSLLPANVDDIDLQVSGPLKEKPSWQPTNATSLLHRWILNKAHRDLMELPPDMPSHDKYQHVLALDTELRKWISDAPTASDHRSDGGSYQSAVWRQWSAITELHGQLMHIHRPYMVRGYTDERYAYSVRVCLESAKVVCEARQYLKESIVDERFWWSSMRWLTAAIVIFIDLYQAIDAGYADDILELKKSEIPGIYEILQARQSSIYGTTKSFAYSATRVIDNLLEAEKTKRSAASSRRGSIAGTSKEPEAEHVGATLQRIAKNLSSADSAKARSRSHTEGEAGPTTVQNMSGYSTAPGVQDRSERILRTQVPLKRKTIRAAPPPDQASYRSPSTSSQGPNPVHRSGSLASMSGQGLNASPVPRRLTPAVSMPTLLPPHTVQNIAYLVHPVQGAQTQQQPLPPPQLSQVPAIPDPAAAAEIQAYFTPAPISWDTAEMFHPDPSALLHSMGYSYPGADQFMPSGQITPDISGLPNGMDTQREWTVQQQSHQGPTLMSPDAPLYTHTGAEQQAGWYGYAAEPQSHHQTHNHQTLR